MNENGQLQAPAQPPVDNRLAKQEPGLKFDAGKLQHSLLDQDFLNGLMRVLAHGKAKYGANNWRRGMSYSRLYDALQRHLAAFRECEDLDPETGEHHLLHAGCCLMFLCGMELGNKTFYQQYDNRPFTDHEGETKP